MKNKQMDILGEEFNRFQVLENKAKELPPSDYKAEVMRRIERLRNNIVYTDALIEQNKDVGVIILRIQKLLDDFHI